MRISRWGAAAAVGAAVALALAAPAAGHHAGPEVTAGEPGECGELTISAGDWAAEEHQVDTARLVVQAAAEQHTAQVGESVTVGPFETAEVTVRYRLWGGGERDYDSPAVDDLDALVAYLEEDGDRSPLDPDAPGLAWHEVTVQGCEPSPSPSPTETADPEPTASPEPEATESPAAGTAGGEELPQTGTGSVVLLAGGGVLLLALGGGAAWAARRRRVSFSS